ncbi:predicted protein [Botrytis cinerea T4]|uniref:Uncharacterized protein n=1 Tax=Botryotinia fuckeliana (strain T4) TaxID=999810 RepID=G2XWD3_BOTF4|nr:predicted protein [Botrytis cinerea T4]
MDKKFGQQKGSGAGAIIRYSDEAFKILNGPTGAG